jgi:hypothetical protein
MVNCVWKLQLELGKRKVRKQSQTESKNRHKTKLVAELLRLTLKSSITTTRKNNATSPDILTRHKVKKLNIKDVKV